MQLITSCWKCAERHVGCHGSCQCYLDAKAKAEQDELRRREFLRVENELIGYKFGRSTRRARFGG